MTRHRLFIFGPLAIALLASVISFTAVARSAPGDSLAALGSGFTYQGELVDDGQPVDDVCDFQFSLWDDPGSGSQVGATQTSEDVAVVAGRFTALVNDANQFGSNAFNGDARWLEIGVRCTAGGGAYTVLNQRQPLTPTPYALFAALAEAVPWSGLIHIPAGFADNVDDDTTYTGGLGLELTGTQFDLADGYRLPQLCSTDQLATWDGSAWVCSDATGTGAGYANIIVVAQSGGDYSSIQTALDSITDAADDNGYLLLVAPGVYSETVAMKEYVDIEGAGEELVKITASGSSNSSEATVTGADNAGLRKLTVNNTGNDSYAVAIYNANVSPRLAQLTVLASDSTEASYAIYNTGSATPQITDARVTATGTNHARAINNLNSSSAIVKNTEATISGCATGVCYAIAATGSGSSVTLENVTAKSLSDGNPTSVAIFASLNATLTLSDVTAFAAGGATSNSALMLVNASATVRDSILSADDSAGSAYGLAAVSSISNSPQTLTVSNSELHGSSHTLRILHDDSTVNVAGTLLDGGAVNNSGGSALTCAGVYDEGYNFSASTCP